MLEANPDRIGHVIFINDEIRKKIVDKKVPIEICITSNVKGKQVPKYDDHHFREFYNLNHPLSLSTDDTVLFNTTVTLEYCYAAIVCGLSEGELKNIAKSSFNYCFLDNNVIQNLLSKYNLM